MKFFPTTLGKTLSFVACLLFVLISCSKDEDFELFKDAVLNTPTSIQETVKDTTDNLSSELVEEGSEGDSLTQSPLEKTLEKRTNDFLPVNDAYLGSGKGYNQPIVRLEKDVRTSYLMFDLSQIKAIGGHITTLNLEFTIDSDQGDGKVSVFMGNSNDWSEKSLSENNAPETKTFLGSIEDDFTVGSTYRVALDTINVEPKIITLILIHEYGNDFAFSSKEGNGGKPPILQVEFEAPIGANSNNVLTSTAENGSITGNSASVQLEKNESPIAIAEGKPLVGDAPLKVEFSASKSTDDKAIVAYFWDFKDGSTAIDQNPSHTFSEAGTYSVALSVKDEEEMVHTTHIEVVVNARPLNANTNTPTDTGAETTSGVDTNNENSTPKDTGSYPPDAVFASSFGYSPSDATEALKAALTSGSSYVIVDKQSQDWVVGPLKLFDLKDLTIVFEPGVVLRAKKGSFSNLGSSLFQLVRAKNITIEGNGAVFKMDKTVYGDGENRHVLAINQSEDISISELTLRDGGGDGIYISGGGALDYSKNITLKNILSTNNHRNGMSIISAENVWVENCEFSKSSGVRPENGVDLEPNQPNERLVNINFINCKFLGNDSSGFKIAPGNLTSSSKPISVTVKDSEFRNNVVAPVDGVFKTELIVGQGTHSNPVKGNVHFERLTFNGSKHRIFKSKKSADAYHVIFKDCSAYNVGTSGGRSIMELEALSGENTLGGFTFENFYIEYRVKEPFLKINAPSYFTVKDIKGDFILKEPNDIELLYNGGYNPSANQNVEITYTHID
ncbi:PKD domain-containing protein [Pareuzebyella sediminis]|uniref:PKD domain-containing protein n=1 Tax=Pareuzebyella sediminis TaxID=2607998 RepID=UPI0011F01AA3|nr:PKD domain-containing protein [Pareuzebyella sediminis]